MPQEKAPGLPPVQRDLLVSVCWAVTPAVRQGSALEAEVAWLIWWYFEAPAKRLRPEPWPPYAELDSHRKAIERMVIASFTDRSTYLTIRRTNARVRAGITAVIAADPQRAKSFEYLLGLLDSMSSVPPSRPLKRTKKTGSQPATPDS